MEEILLKIEAVFNNRSFLLFFAGMGLGYASIVVIDLTLLVWKKCKQKVGNAKASGRDVPAVADGVKPSCDNEECGSNG
jgi:hypothetical protein